MKSRNLPNAGDLRTAVWLVIESNRSDGYRPTRFIGATGGGNAPDLVQICTSLVAGGDTLMALEKALQRVPSLLTIEDLIARSGNLWGFSPPTIEMASARVDYFDRSAGFKRYVTDDQP